MNDKKRNLVIILFWRYPLLWATVVVTWLSKIIDSQVEVFIQQGLDKEQIFQHANQFFQYTLSDIDEMIQQRNKQKFKRLLENYHTLGEPYKGRRFDQVRVMGKCPIDIPYGVILKITIDQAIENLAKDNWELAAILKMRYIDHANIQDIINTFGISRRTIFNRLNEAIDKITSIIDKGAYYN